MNRNTVTFIIITAGIALATFGAGICPTAVNSGACAPPNAGPYPPACIKATCSSGVANAQSCAGPYTQATLCLAGSATWSCSYLVYPQILSTNLIANDCNNCNTPNKCIDGKCYSITVTGCDIRFPQPYSCQNGGSYPCSGTCPYDAQDLVDSPICQSGG